MSRMLSNGNSFSEGNSYGGGGKTTERECPFIRRLLQVAERP